VDDGSEEPLAPLISEYRSMLEITGLRIEHGGPAAARNRGSLAARGRFLAFTDDDCAPAPGWLSALMARLKTDPDAMIGGCITNALVDNPYSAASQLILDLVYNHRQQRSGPLRFFASNNIAMAADFFRELGGFDAAFRTSEDRDLCDRWLGAGRRLVYAPEALVYHSNRLDLHSFWRQHFGYGRGACRFYRAHRRRSAGKTEWDWSFYQALPRRLPPLILRQKNQRLLLAFLMAVWQAANLMGFLRETVSRRDSGPPAGGGAR
jgi:GT2 family glycosyltransferase